MRVMYNFSMLIEMNMSNWILRFFLKYAFGSYLFILHVFVSPSACSQFSLLIYILTITSHFVCFADFLHLI